MSKRYAPEHRALVLRMLDVFKGDILTTARFCQIPERTLRDWHAQRAAQQQSAARQQPAARPGAPVTIQIVRRKTSAAPPPSPSPSPTPPRRRE
jgi:hypothetical protein